VIGIRNEHRIDRPRRQHGIVHAAVNHVQVRIAVEPGADPQKGQRLPAEVDGEDATVRGHARRHLQREIACARAQVHHSVPGAESEVPQDVVRALPRVALPFDADKRAQRPDGFTGDVDDR
jgi:hypothetical protein